MGIVDEDIARVRDATDIVKVISEHLQLKRVGQRWVGLCPFHQERTPSLSVNAERGLYYCFGCGASGDAITFVREIDHLDFPSAIEALAGRAGVVLRYTERAEGEGRQQRRTLVELMERAVDFYHQRLLTGGDAGRARAYLRSRGLEGEVVRRYRLGWAPDEFDALARHLRAPERHMVPETGTGLAFINRRQRQQDFFRARLLFPIFDVNGDPVAFGGRKLPGAEGPKYRNSPDGALYHKSRVLYGLNWAKSDIVRQDRVVLCEGYTDVIGFAQAGLPIAVATCGTALTEDHVKVLKKFTRRVVLAFDPDAAGQAAADRVYGWERTHDLEVSVAELPDGVDPGEMAATNPEGLRHSVEQARPFLGYRVERVFASADLATPEGRARAAERAAMVIAEHPDDLTRGPYALAVADRCRLEEDAVLERVARFRSLPRDQWPDRRGDRSTARARGPEPATAAPPTPRPPIERDTPETEALRLAIHRPADTLPLLAEHLFADRRHVDAFAALREHQGDVGAAVASLQDASDASAALLTRLAVEETDASPFDVAARLVDIATGRALADLQRESRQSDDPLAYTEVLGWLVRQRDELRREGADGRAAATRLVDWLGHRAGETP